MPFLDTDDPEGVRLANEVLRDRGYPRPVVLVLRVLAGPGLWYQVFMWEEWSLIASDVYYGYCLLLIPVSLLSAIWSFELALLLAILAGFLYSRATVGWRKYREVHSVPKDAGR